MISYYVLVVLVSVTHVNSIRHYEKIIKKITSETESCDVYEVATLLIVFALRNLLLPSYYSYIYRRILAMNVDNRLDLLTPRYLAVNLVLSSRKLIAYTIYLHYAL